MAKFGKIVAAVAALGAGAAAVLVLKKKAEDKHCTCDEEADHDFDNDSFEETTEDSADRTYVTIPVDHTPEAEAGEVPHAVNPNVNAAVKPSERIFFLLFFIMILPFFISFNDFSGFTFYFQFSHSF